MKWALAILALFVAGVPHLIHKGDLLDLALVSAAFILAWSSGLMFYHDESKRVSVRLKESLSSAKLMLDIVAVDYKVNGIENATSRRLSYVREELSRKPSKKRLAVLEREMNLGDPTVPEGTNSV